MTFAKFKLKNIVSYEERFVFLGAFSKNQRIVKKGNRIDVTLMLADVSTGAFYKVPCSKISYIPNARYDS